MIWTHQDMFSRNLRRIMPPVKLQSLPWVHWNLTQSWQRQMLERQNQPNDLKNWFSQIRYRRSLPVPKIHLRDPPQWANISNYKYLEWLFWSHSCPTKIWTHLQSWKILGINDYFLHWKMKKRWCELFFSREKRVKNCRKTREILLEFSYITCRFFQYIITIISTPN